MNKLDQLGSRYRQILAELRELTPKLHSAMRHERAEGATQNEVRQKSGYKTIQQVRVILGEAKGGTS